MVRHVDAIFRKGVFRPLEPLTLPDGARVHLSVEEETRGEDTGASVTETDRADAEISQWSQEMDASTAQIPAEEHDRFLQALDDIERESKEAVRKQWGLP